MPRTVRLKTYPLLSQVRDRKKRGGGEHVKITQMGSEFFRGTLDLNLKKKIPGQVNYKENA